MFAHEQWLNSFYLWDKSTVVHIKQTLCETISLITVPFVTRFQVDDIYTLFSVYIVNRSHFELSLILCNVSRLALNNRLFKYYGQISDIDVLFQRKYLLIYGMCNVYMWTSYCKKKWGCSVACRCCPVDFYKPERFIKLYFKLTKARTFRFILVSHMIVYAITLSIIHIFAINMLTKSLHKSHANTVKWTVVNQ